MPGSLRLRAFLSPVLVLAVALTWACGGDGGGDGVTPPDGGGVASVSVSPSSRSMEVGDTFTFLAAARDAEGALLNRSVSWASSATSVATVSSSGTVTAVGAGQATLTATVDGVSGTASLTVTLPAAVVASGPVGTAGGTVGNDDVGVTIPAGAFGGTTTVEILKAESTDPVFGSSAVTGNYYLKGFPTDREVDVRVRLKTSGTVEGPSMVGLSVPIYAATDDSTGWRTGLLLREAVDSAGYLVATIPVRGMVPEPLNAGPFRAAGVDGLLDGLLGGVDNTRTDTVPGGLWVVRSFGAPRAELNTKVGRVIKLLEDAHKTLDGQGYSMAHRTKWPIDVQVHPIPDAYGLFGQKGPFPLDVNTGWFEFDVASFDKPDMPGTAIHEYYHFIQARYTGNKQWAQYKSYSWLKEAGSTWVEEKAPETLGVFRNSFFRGQRGDLFLGLYPSLTADEGYGKAPMIKYIADNQGTATVRSMWTAVGGGTNAIDALLNSFPSSPEVWWPDLLTKYMKGEIIALAGNELTPNVGAIPVKAGIHTWKWNNKMKPLGAQWLHFTPKPADYGTGTTLTFRMTPTLKAAGAKYLPFRMSASGAWEEMGGAQDSVVIKGSELKDGREIGIYLIQTKPTAPYTQEWDNEFTTDLGFVEGDYATANATVTSNDIAYTRSEGDTTSIDVAGQAVSTFSALSLNGVWKRDAQEPNKYTWEPTDEYRQVLASYNATAESWAQVFANGDSLYLTATADINPPAAAAATSQAPGHAAAFGGAALLLLTGVLFRRRRGILMVALLGAVGLGTWGCNLGSINITMRYVYEFRFGSPKFTASAEDATVPWVQYTAGKGTMKVERYKLEWWEYIRDEDDVIVDSVAHATTASGNAGLTVDVGHYPDGVLTDDDDEQLQQAAQTLRLDPGILRQLVKPGGR